MNARMLKQTHSDPQKHAYTFTRDVAGGQNHSSWLELLLVHRLVVVRGKYTSVKPNPKWCVAFERKKKKRNHIF